MIKFNASIFYVSLIVLQGALWGLGNAWLPMAYDAISPLTLLGIRFFFTTLLFLPFFGRKAIKELKHCSPSVWLPFALCGAATFVTSNLALNLTNVTAAGFLMSLSVAFTPFLSRFFLKEKIHPSTILIVLTSVIGLFFLSTDGGSFSLSSGDWIALLCSLFVAGTLVFSKGSMETLSPGTVCLVQSAVTCVVGISGGLLFETTPVWQEIPYTIWLIVLYLIICSSFLSYLLQNVAIKHLSATTVAVTQCSEPFFTAIFAGIFLAEHLSISGIIGCGILLITIVYGNLIQGLPAVHHKKKHKGNKNK